MTSPESENRDQLEGDYTPSEHVNLEIEILSLEIAARQAQKPKKKTPDQDESPEEHLDP